MLNLIDAIIEIDKEARLQVEQAREAAREVTEEAENECEKVRAWYDTRTQKRLLLVEDAYLKIAGEDTEIINKNEKERISVLEETMTKYKAEWKAEILNRITNGFYNYEE